MTEIRQTLRLTDLNLDEANLVLGQIQDRLDEMEGRRGTPKFHASVDMQGNQITNAAPSTSASDAIVKSELQEMQASLSEMVQKAWPIGSIFISTVSTNPADSIGFGTWEIFGAGKFLVGLDSADTAFDTVGETGGSKTKDLSHTHDMGDHTHTINHTHPAGAGLAVGAAINPYFGGSSGTPSTNTTSSGGSLTQDILPPYMVVYFWKRTA